MIIGYLTTISKPNETAELIAMGCEYKGISFLYLNPKDIVESSEKITGRMLFEDGWKRVTIPLPKFIDISISSYNRLSDSQKEYLQNKTKLSDNGLNRINNGLLQNHLSNDQTLKEFAIPTKQIHNFEDIILYLDKYKEIIIKPISGQYDKNVYYLSNFNNKNFVFKIGTDESLITIQKLEELYKHHFKNGKYIIQRYIDSSTDQDYPFDCRVNVMKDSNNKWVIAKKHIRIGINQSGGVSDTPPFLKANFPEKQQLINKNLNKVSKLVAHKIEKIRKQNLIIIGIDFGIDKNGDIFIFQVTSNAETKNFRDRAALLKVDYYDYISKNDNK